MAEGYSHERDQAVLRAPWRPAVARLLTLDEHNLLGSNPAYRTLLSQLEHQFATLSHADAAAQLRAAMTAPGAPSVRFLRIRGGT